MNVGRHKDYFCLYQYYIPSLLLDRTLSSFPVHDPSNSKYAKNDVEPMLFRKQCVAFLSTDTARPLAVHYLEFSNPLITSRRKFYKQIRVRFVFFAISGDVGKS